MRAGAGHKTRLCTYFQQGRCGRGADCGYAHGEAELRGGKGIGKGGHAFPRPAQAAAFPDAPARVAQPPAVARGADRRGSRPCQFYQQGRCNRGDDCTFSHEDTGDTPPEARGYQPRVKKKTQLCIHFERRGNCRNGSSCDFAHGEEELEAVTSLADATCGPHIPKLRDTQPHNVAGWLRKLSEAEDPDTKTTALRSSRDLLVAALEGFSLENLETLVEVLCCVSNYALREDMVECVLKGLAGSLVRPLVLRYVSTVPTADKLDTLLEVLLALVGADPDSGIILETARVQTALEQAVQRCGSQRSPNLLRLIKEGDTQGREVLRRVVRGQERRAAAAIAANVGRTDDEPLLPSLADLLKSPSGLPSNRSTAWQHAEELDLYTHTHYQLCREELLAPLREAITAFFVGEGVQLPPGARVPKEQSLYFAYTDVEVVEFALSSTGQPTIRLRFGTGNRKVDFSTGDHLIYGSLVVLFCLQEGGKPNTEFCIYATIEEFDPELVKKRTVGVSLLDPDDWGRFSVLQRFAMVESPGYFHAARPVLEWLREPGSVGNIPLVADIFSGERSRTPTYIQGARVDISCLYKRDLHKKEAWRSCNPLAPWPHPDDIELDGSQQEALRHILTSTVPLVQGPPGTGKSYIGVKALQIIRQALDTNSYDEPVVLICLTNHALDQFLEDLLDLFPGRLARFGGRSKSEDPRLAECSVNKFLRSTREEREDREEQEAELRRMLEKLEQHRWVLSNVERQALLLLAAMSIDVLMDIFEAVGADLVETGLFLPPSAAGSTRRKAKKLDNPDPVDFVACVFKAFVEGTDLADLQEALRARLPDLRGAGQGGSVRVTNRFAALEEEDTTSGNSSRAPLLSPFDRYLGGNPDVTGLQNSSEVWNDDSDNENDVQIEDEEDIQNLLDDRQEDGGGRRMRRRPRQRVVFDGRSFLDQAVHARSVCFQRCCHASGQARHNVAGLREEWQRARRNLRKEVLQVVRNRIRELLGNLPWEALTAGNLSWRRSPEERMQALRTVAGRAAQASSEVYRQGFREAQGLAARLGQMKKLAQLRVCQKAKVVGMTSTFAALNRDLLQRMRPRVVIVEEAGELLECQLMACLSSPHLEHVVLIGDHRQLRPKVNTYDLCRHQHYDISLFERLVVQGCKHSQLTTQLRMQPQVCDLVRFFYQNIEDHARVRMYPPVAGVASSVYWISHEERENGGGTVSRSKTNVHEAKFACRLAQHLVFNGIDKARITLLTPYIGQKRLFKQYLHEELHTTGGVKGKGQAKGKGKGKGEGDGEPPVVRGVRIVTIDDYQGEENDVIILSLVRCNAERKLGFCGIENRIIVALSRARHGLFILGDSKMFRTSDHWFKVLGKLEEKKQVGAGLNLKCLQHPDDDGLVCSPAEFDSKARHGGCQRPCGSLLPACGHRCPYRCHPFDREHEDIQCTKMCERPRPAGCNHKCAWRCRDCWAPTPEDACPTPCEEPVTVRLPCGHDQAEPCFNVQTPELLAAVQCRTIVTVRLPCGHQCQATCAAAEKPDELKCQHKETVTGPCGHKVTKSCTELEPCTHPCEREFEVCAQAHPCERLCGEEHDHRRCGKPCDDILACGHKCAGFCGEPHTELCGEPCARTCSHGYTCPRKCWEDCTGCHEHCSWRCPHGACTKLCCEPCDKIPCEKPCAKRLPCGHPCKGKCGEPCPRCVDCFDPDGTCPISLESFSDLEFLYQLDCGHIFDCEQMDRYMQAKPQSGEHIAIQAKCCPTCRKQVHKTPRYGSVVKEQLKLIDAMKREVQRQHRNQDLTAEERRQVDMAMGGGRSAGGHWFACPNGHPYFIGNCGGAMEESQCPACGAQVGGGSHTLRQDNSYIADFAGTGAVQPAWPGMDGRPQGW